MSKEIELNGTVEDVFGNRFTITADGRKFLVDLGPHGQGDNKIEVGQTVSVKGEEKPGEVKATSLRVGDGEWSDIKRDEKDHGPKPHDKADKGEKAEPSDAPKPPHGGEGKKPEDADAAQEPSDDQVTKMLNDEGYTDHGERTRKPKHVEVIASKDGQRHKVHVHKDGVKKTEPAE